LRYREVPTFDDGNAVQVTIIGVTVAGSVRETVGWMPSQSVGTHPSVSDYCVKILPTWEDDAAKAESNPANIRQATVIRYSAFCQVYSTASVAIRCIEFFTVVSPSS
jgi:hypothetical protein